ncbi:SusC/RagA family TonB-linked outer membrane protein [Flavobacterium sp. NRK1]|uniref:SusC/RagA family TonB-linked outer membrane protein n=1 Tax=Flavobacterium sp. NRK1 TaxID=2954929 RepID=UPI002092581B|nr:SusC/RagA family TonB-linked outer membrane protein [Flavobacterium sp. NRK1]MCO6146955.1 SusC/RagA family TonB-linked outer membrane protein [Flavobacterium sp. NRK1]
MKTRLRVLLTLLMALMMQITFAQQRAVSGTVTDEGGFPIPGVNVLIKGTTTGTQTDIDGKFTIQAAPTDVLVFSYIGMKTRETLAATTSMNITMADDAIELEGVVVTAFGIKRNPKDLGYSVSTVKNTDLTENSEPDLIRSLNGKVPGVNVNVSTGVAGAANQITIRGTSSLTGNTQPLIIVDGVAYNNTEVQTSSQVTGGGGYENGLSSLDPNDIASMNVLKGAAASALYGSRAMNGVIVITTKSGSPGNNTNKKLGVTFSNGTYFENIANLPDYQNTYGAGANFLYSNANGSWGPRFDSLETIPTWPNLANAFPGQFGPTVPYVAKPNNVKDLFRTGTVLENSLNLNYSGEDGNFNLTLSDLNQDGYIPYNTYDRTSISTGGSFKLKNGITLGSNLSYAQTKQVGGFFGENQYDGASSSFARTLFLARNWDFNLPYEDPVTGASVVPNAGYDHPLWSWKHDKITTQTQRTVASFNVGYSFNDHISTSYRLGINKYDLARRQIRDLNSRADTGVGSITIDNFTNEDIESTLLFNFDYKISDKIGFTGILGNNIFQNSQTREAYYGRDFAVPDVYSLKNTKEVSNLADNTNRKRTLGFFADATFSYNNFLFLNGTARNDITSSLNPGHRSYFYPSGSLSFILTEALKMDSKVLTFAKLRTSYAKVGRDTSAEQLSLTYVLNNTFNGQPTIGNPTTFPNQNMEPEFAREFEIGTDLEFFNRRITLDFTYYNKDAYNLIFPVQVPSSSGYGFYATNGGAMTNKGLEIGLTLVPVQTENFKWTWTTNFTKNKNNVYELSNGLERTQLDPNEVAYAIPGQPFGVFYGTKFARDDQGNYLINPAGGGIIQDPELGIIGDPNPDFKMNFINSFSYKGITLRAQIDWRQGGDVSSSTIESLLGRGVTKDTEDREHTFIIPGYYGNNDGTPILDASGNKIPNTTQLSMNELYFSPAGGNTFAINSVDEARIYDGTVYRLRELSLIYDLPQKFIEKTPFGRVSFGFIANNLWYWAPNVPKYTNFDPETTSYGSSNLQGIEVSAAPTAKRYGFRLNVSF